MILVFGESTNDAEAVRRLTLGLCPTAVGKIKVLRRPPSLQRTASARAVRDHASKVASVVRAQAALTRVTCVLVHSDADGPDPEGQLEQERSQQLLASGVPHAHAVVPAQELEAWWLLFPDATESVIPGWRGSLRSSPGDVDSQRNPKEELIRRTRRKHPRRPYKESDSADIAARVAELGVMARPTGASKSFDRFRRTIADCCERLTNTG
jgi:hypothetical protein